MEQSAASWRQAVNIRSVTQMEGLLMVALLTAVFQRTAKAQGSGDQGSGDITETARGQWSSWEHWGACNRRCGDGVRQRVRACGPPSGSDASSNNTRVECVGEHRMWEFCLHRERCNETLRQEDCASYDSDNVTWTPVVNFEDDYSRCQLFCQRWTETVSSLGGETERKRPAPEGTSCRQSSRRDICLDKRCQTLACPFDMDELTNSCPYEDCTVICGVAEATPVGAVWRSILGIPKCASQVHFHRLRGYMDFKVLTPANKGSLQDYLLWNQYPQEKSGTYWDGNMSYHVNYTNPLTVTITEPLQNPISVEALFEQTSIAYHYRLKRADCMTSANEVQQYDPDDPKPDGEFNVFDELYINLLAAETRREAQRIRAKERESPNTSPSPTSNRDWRTELTGNENYNFRTYEWRHWRYSPCSRSCGGGKQEARAVCIWIERDEEVDESICSQTISVRPPPKSRKCSNWSCLAEWQTSDWSECLCDAGQVQHRSVTCKQVIRTGETIEVTPKKCAGRRPVRQRSCSESCLIRWNMTRWSHCSAACGIGQKTRIVNCMRGDEIMPDEACITEAMKQRAAKLPKPLRKSRPRSRKDCTGICVEWKTTPWGECSAGCGDGLQSRHVICINPNHLKHGAFVHPSWRCRHLPNKPASLRRCYATRTCRPAWHVGIWGKCSSRCGQTGIQKRTVWCMYARPTSDKRHHLPDKNCSPKVKPQVVRTCHRKPCRGDWVKEPWGSCSVSCGDGVRTRIVYCALTRRGRRIVARNQCDEGIKPQSEQPCRQFCKNPKKVCKDKVPPSHCQFILRYAASRCNDENTPCCETCASLSRQPLQ